MDIMKDKKLNPFSIEHDIECLFRKARDCAVAIECEHGHDVCPICDPCTCKDKKPNEIDSKA